MLFMNRCAAIQIGNGAGYLEDAVIGAGGETETVGDQFQHAVAAGVQFAEFLDEAGRHLGVTVDFGPFVAIRLNVAGMFHPRGNGCGAFGFTPIGQVAILDRRHLDVDVDPVQERPGDARAVAVNGNRCAGAGMDRVGQVAAGAGVCAPFSTILTQDGTCSQFKFPSKNNLFPVIPNSQSQLVNTSARNGWISVSSREK